MIDDRILKNQVLMMQALSLILRHPQGTSRAGAELAAQLHEACDETSRDLEEYARVDADDMTPEWLDTITRHITGPGIATVRSAVPEWIVDLLEHDQHVRAWYSLTEWTRYELVAQHIGVVLGTGHGSKKLWQLFEERWRDKCLVPCVGEREACSCWQWAVTRELHPPA